MSPDNRTSRTLLIYCQRVPDWVRCRATWLSDDPQPGWVLYEFLTADGQLIREEDKPIWTVEEIPETSEPIDVWFPVVGVQGVDPVLVTLPTDFGAAPSTFAVRPADVRRAVDRS